MCEFTLPGLSTDDGANVTAVLQKQLSAYNHLHLIEDLLISHAHGSKSSNSSSEPIWRTQQKALCTKEIKQYSSQPQKRAKTEPAVARRSAGYLPAIGAEKSGIVTQREHRIFQRQQRLLPGSTMAEHRSAPQRSLPSHRTTSMEEFTQ